MSPTTLPSSIVGGIAVGKAAADKAAGGRKMLESTSAAPNCCTSLYTVKQGDTLNSIATAYGQPTNGPAILQVPVPHAFQRTVSLPELSYTVLCIVTRVGQFAGMLCVMRRS